MAMALPLMVPAGLDVVINDFEFFSAGNCIVPLVDGLVPNKVS
jgi:hypothetical protein